MRQVILNGQDGPCADPVLQARLAGHLRARLAEYEVDGIHAVLGSPGQVLAEFVGLTGQQAADRLAALGVYALAAGETVRFSLGPGVTFEDLDYVQAAAAQLL